MNVLYVCSLHFAPVKNNFVLFTFNIPDIIISMIINHYLFLSLSNIFLQDMTYFRAQPEKRVHVKPKGEVRGQT